MANQNNNLAIWNAVETTDPKYTKGFNRGGGFKGTSTNATYLTKKATNQFGPIGIGWGWTVLEENFVNGQDKDVIHILKIKLWYKWNDQRGEIEHFGQTQFVGKEPERLLHRRRGTEKIADRRDLEVPQLAGLRGRHPSRYVRRQPLRQRSQE
jgi:hypothetical protein